MKKINHSDQANDSITHLQTELPLNISAPGQVYTRHPVWDSLDTAPYWDELEQKHLEPKELLVVAAPEQTQPFPEQISCKPYKCNLVEDSNKTNVTIESNMSRSTASEEPQAILEQFYIEQRFDSTAHEHTPLVRAQPVEVAHEHTHWVEKYWVRRCGNKYYYYRYMWMEGRKKRTIHLGSVRSSLAQKRVEWVREAIALGKSPLEIKQLISSPLRDNPKMVTSI